MPFDPRAAAGAPYYASERRPRLRLGAFASCGTNAGGCVVPGFCCACAAAALLRQLALQESRPAWILLLLELQVVGQEVVQFAQERVDAV